MNIVEGLILGSGIGFAFLVASVFIADKWNQLARKKWLRENKISDYSEFGPIEIKIKTGGHNE